MRGNNNVDVISSWRVYCYVNSDGKNAIWEWMDAQAVSLADRMAFQVCIDVLEGGGPEMLQGVISKVEGDFFALKIKPRKGVVLSPVFCYGPFYEMEITLLAGAPIENGLLGPKEVLPIARHNLADLKSNHDPEKKSPRRRLDPVA